MTPKRVIVQPAAAIFSRAYSSGFEVKSSSPSMTMTACLAEFAEPEPELQLGDSRKNLRRLVIYCFSKKAKALCN
ncbi:hypothetical protein CISIN_1g040387mg [Citrus sinensis]|uniref:Uncharacterized protein n=1 Tax=Citrus sinensis TaxID=2711 RepID=A0A067DD07_CITSI|nr:hypothetical protein CISIN_1g040387mg [Citrus sinensis]